MHPSVACRKPAMLSTRRVRWRRPSLCPPQGIRWIMNRESAAGLVVIQQSQPKYIDKVRHLGFFESPDPAA